jgi:hypothetical protein
VIERIQIHISSFFIFDLLHKCEKNDEKRILDHFFWEKKIIRFQKNENHVYWFCFGALIIKKKVPRTCHQLM